MYQIEHPIDSYNYATLANVLIAPLRNGDAIIRSLQMSDHPAISPNFPTDEGDIKLSITSFKRIRHA